jgi:hypothetical protein
MRVAEGRQTLVIRALRRILRPLARFLIREQIPYPAFGDLMKQAYVEAADRDFALDGKPQSAARVALLTGVHRREVKRIREAEPEAEVPGSTALGARLVADWLSLPEFRDANGEPLPLNRSSRRAGVSVRDLVERAGQDIRPQTVIDEWLRLGVVEMDAEGRIRLRRESFVPEAGFEEKLDFFARILGAHIATGDHNLAGDGPPWLDQIVWYGGLSPEHAERLQERARELATVALRTWNREARAAQDAAAGAPGADQRVHFGAFVHADRSGGGENDG